MTAFLFLDYKNLLIGRIFYIFQKRLPTFYLHTNVVLMIPITHTIRNNSLEFDTLTKHQKSICKCLLGEFPSWLLAKESGLSFGTALDWTLDQDVLCQFHPSYLVRNANSNPYDA